MSKSEEFNEIFYRDPYAREFDAEVMECRKEKKGFEIVLSDTAFYPEGGGQPGDTGWLFPARSDASRPAGSAETQDEGSVHISDTVKKDGVIVHMGDGFIVPGTKVHGAIDWDRRFQNMQGHTGEHILSGLIHRKYGYDNVGFHIGDRIRIDFNGTLTWNQLEEMELQANRVIWSDVPVRELYPSDAELKDIDYRSKKELTGKIRIIDIPEADCCACCGTHVKRTGEVGLVKCLSMMHYKGGVRIELLCGRQAFEYLQEIMRMNSGMAAGLSVKPEETEKAVHKMSEELVSYKKQAAENLNRYFRLRAEQFPSGSRVLVDFETGLDPADARRFCDQLVKEGKAQVVAVLSSDAEPEQADVFRYVIGSASEGGSPVVNLREEAKKMNAALHGRGGGSPEMIQGSFSAEKAEIQAFLEKN